MTAVRVHILTTEGPATVQGLVVESYDNDVLATICLDGTTEQLPICRDYHMFVDQFIRPLTGERRYRMDIDNRIDGGKKLAPWRFDCAFTRRGWEVSNRWAVVGIRTICDRSYSEAAQC